jgi:phosphocarrier protein FPr
VAELAKEMGGADARLAVAGGLDAPDRPLGTDAMLVLRAIEEVWSDDGVLVLMDLGSAVLSAEMALDFLDDDRRANVVLSDAPVVEGAVAAVVAARLGEPLERVAEEARRGLLPKSTHLGEAAPAPTSDEVSAAAEPADDPAHGQELVLTVENPHGLHARPGARLVQTVGRFDAEVMVENLTKGTGPVSGRSLISVTTLDVHPGHVIRLRATGAQAAAALAAIEELAADHFGDPPPA